MRQKLVMMSALLLLAILPGCATTTGSVAVTDAASFCAVARPILWSVRDSDDTIRQVREHNAAGVEICRWGRP